MSDELEPRDEPRLEKDEELVIDFADLFLGDDARPLPGKATAGDTDEETLDELDAFLDTFEMDLDLPDTNDFDEMNLAGAEDEALAISGEAERGVALDSSGLELEVGLDEESSPEEAETQSVSSDDDWADEMGRDDELLELYAILDEADSSVTPVQADLPLDSPDMAAAAAVAAAAAMAADKVPPHDQGTPPAATPALSRTQLIGGAVVFSLTLLLSLAALWLGWGMTSQIDALNQNVSELQQRVLAQSRRGTLAPPAQLDEQLAGLEERVNDLAVIIEGPMSHLRESSQQELKALELRLGRLEQGPAQQRQSPLATDNTAAPGKSDPAPVVPAPLASNEWVINLLSVTSARSANDEVARLLQLGIRAEHQKVSEGGSTWYRLRVTGFDSYAGARSYIDTIERQTGFSSAWVAKK